MYLGKVKSLRLKWGLWPAKSIAVQNHKQITIRQIKMPAPRKAAKQALRYRFKTVNLSYMMHDRTKDGSANTGPTITVLLQPEENTIILPRYKTARQLLAALGLPEETAIVAREGELLTPDRQILAGDKILVRKVVSSG